MQWDARSDRRGSGKQEGKETSLPRTALMARNSFSPTQNGSGPIYLVAKRRGCSGVETQTRIAPSMQKKDRVLAACNVPAGPITSV